MGDMTADSEVAAVPRYEYTKLPGSRTIGLLYIDPVPPQKLWQPLVISFSEASLDDLGSYAVLSYSWATSDDNESMRQSKLVSCGDGTGIMVTPNCDSALRRMRSWLPPDWKAEILIDSICTNQSNDDETSQQVAMMAQIYTKAYITIAWVGEESI
ncbi:hypothetical protein BP5796_12707 [Coleophoma crateriformis]|uniref:Heterokaryon incompatibility domain-containing protein n=1 Tax=Coleophoma crateriformis TaxID=565419 RepID=A0A3D8Q6E2_9HELO|nr:hypothetical protein BP5796_12707 [Coleophoma crateriformis]